MQIEIVNVTVEAVPTARGQYKKAKVIYKNKSFQDKVEEKQIMDFTFPKVFNTIEQSKFGDVLEIIRNKNDKGYWDWTDIGTETNPPYTEQGAGMINKPVANVSPKSTYETAEERAKRQVMIVRQSSISSAVAALKLDKAALDATAIITMAKQFENYVMGNTIEDIPEDVPFVVN